MNYIGSKLSLLTFLEESINRVVDNACATFCDLFAGTGVVGRHFKQKNYAVIANDIQYYSYVLNRHYIGNCRELPFAKLCTEIPSLKSMRMEKRKHGVCDYLSQLDGREGFIYKNYCFGGTKNSAEPRQYFSDTNGMRCDAIRQTIALWKQERRISDDEYYFLLATLIESVDAHANTAAVYGAFLKHLKRSAQHALRLKPAELIVSTQTHAIFNENINEVVKKVAGDIVYLDPPYNQRQYATNYHLLETIARYDNPKIYGKSGLRDYQHQKSRYCSRAQVTQTFKDLILHTNARYIFVSYNNEGLIALNDIKEIMSLRGKYGNFITEYSRFKADRLGNRRYKADKTIEYLHYVICT